MLHIAKLCVGVTDIGHLRDLQADRKENIHRTRSFPRRASEVIDGGSLYWVIAGAMVVRQRITDIVEDTLQDGTSCAALHLHRTLVPVAGRPTKPFQGWRYLDADAAPADLTRAMRARGEEELPQTLKKELRALGLL